MFYEVRIKDPQGKLKKIISSKELSRKYWKALEQDASAKTQLDLNKKNRKRNKRMYQDFNFENAPYYSEN